MKRYEAWEKVVKKLQALGKEIAKAKEKEELKLEEDEELQALEEQVEESSYLD